MRNLFESTLNALESLVDNIGVDHPFNNITQLMEDILGIGRKDQIRSLIEKAVGVPCITCSGT